MVDHTGRPKYVQVAENLREAIASGTYPVGSELPSTARLTESFGVSTTVVRAAMRELRGEGLIVGQPGKAVYVRAVPPAGSSSPSGDVEHQLRELSALVHDALRKLDARLTALEHERRAGGGT